MKPGKQKGVNKDVKIYVGKCMTVQSFVTNMFLLVSS